MADPDPVTGPPASGWLRAHRIHGLLLVVIAVEGLAALLLHRSDEQLGGMLESGTPKQKVYALYVLTNRDLPQGIDEAFTRSLLDCDEVLIREWTMTTNYTRLGQPRAQQAYIRSLGGSPEAYRCRFWKYYRVGLRHSMVLSEVARFIEAISDGPGTWRFGRPSPL